MVHKPKVLSLKSLRGLETEKKVLILTWNVMLINSFGAWPHAAHSESAGKN